MRTTTAQKAAATKAKAKPSGLLAPLVTANHKHLIKQGLAETARPAF